MTEKNVVEVKWVLCEATGKLRHEGIRLVSTNPKQELFIDYKEETVSPEFMERYKRIAREQKQRGVA